MPLRWIIAAVASVSAGVMAVPIILGNDPPAVETQPATAGELAGSACKAERQANLDFTLEDMNGAKVRLSDFKGKAILLNYWATWCGPCKVEIPIFNELYATYKDQGLVIVGISVDDDGPTLKDFVKHTPMNYPVLLAAGRDEVLEVAGPVYGYPTSFYIDRAGAVCGRHMGLGTKESFEKAIKPLL